MDNISSRFHWAFLSALTSEEQDQSLQPNYQRTLLHRAGRNGDAYPYAHAPDARPFARLPREHQLAQQELHDGHNFQFPFGMSRANGQGDSGFSQGHFLGIGNHQQEQYIDPRLLQKTDPVDVHPQGVEHDDGKIDPLFDGEDGEDPSLLFGEPVEENTAPSEADDLEKDMWDYFEKIDIANQSSQEPVSPVNPGPVPPPALPLALPFTADHWFGPGHQKQEKQQEKKQDAAGDASQRTVETGFMADRPLQPPSSAEPVPRASPAPEDIVNKALAPNTKGKRVTKNAGNKKARKVKPNSCDACRRSKTKCEREEGVDSCNLCKKKNRSCHITGTDGRTNKTNKERCDAAVAAVNKYLKDAVLLCSEVIEHREHLATIQTLILLMDDYAQARLAISNITQRQLNEFRFISGPFRPPIHDGITKLSETRNQYIPELKRQASEQGKIVGSLLIMLVFGSPSQFEVASKLVGVVMQSNSPLSTLKDSTEKNCYFEPNLVHPVHKNILKGVEERINAALA